MPTSPSIDVFARERLAGYSPDVLRRARVAVIGAGALGQNAVLALALSGLGELILVDYDSFEETNRPRSPFFQPNAAKARATAEGFLALATASAPRVYVFTGPVQHVGDLIANDADVIISCVDSNVARAYLAERARLHGTPLVEAGFDGFSISLSVFCNDRADEPCWRCGRDVVDASERGLCTLYARQAEEQGAVPAVQSVAQIAGALVAEHAIAALHGELPLAGKRVWIAVRLGRLTKGTLPLDPACSGNHERVHELATLPVRADATIGQIVAALELGPTDALVLPSPFVRELPCRRCGALVAVGRPFSSVREAPVCGEVCSGAAKPAALPTIYREIGLGDVDLFSLTPAQVGLTPGAVFLVRAAESTRWLAMPGTLTENFTIIERRNGAPRSFTSCPTE